MCVCSLNLKQLNSMLSANGVGTPMDCRRIVHFNDRFIGLSFKTLGLGIVGTPPHVKPVHCSMLFLHDQVLFSHSDNMIRMSEILSNKTVRQSNIFLEFSKCYL